MPKPIIGINACYDRTSHGDYLTFVAVAYPDAVLDAGGIPLIIPLLERRPDRARILRILDGVIMVGGPDIDPRRDGWMLHETTRIMEPRRDAFDRKLMANIFSARIPLLAIGGGMQLMNVHAGGTLCLHIPEDNPEALAHPWPGDGPSLHGMIVEPGSMMATVFGDQEVKVPSSHHMSVDDVARGFRQTAESPDGITEAIESTNPDWLAVGVQFHPEQGPIMNRAIFGEFVTGLQGK
jgi:putative glutamine amidotransferase